MEQKFTKEEASQFAHEAFASLEAGKFGEFMGYSESDYSHIESKAFQLYCQGRYDKALVLLDGLVAMDSHRYYPFLLRGEVMLKMGERIKALDNFRAAIELSPGNITIASKIGEAYLGMGQPERAKEYFDEVLEDTDLPSDHAAKRRARVLREIAVKFVGSAA
jgi:tetratricopeptide (TPR) repeat protein